MAKVTCGLIQMSLKGDGSMEPLAIRDRMIEAHPQERFGYDIKAAIENR